MNNLINFDEIVNSIISFFPKDFEIRLILITAALVIVYGISCLFEHDEVKDVKDI